MKRLYRVTYRYRVLGYCVGSDAGLRNAKIRVEARTAEAACAVAAKLARRACKALGDEKFLRVMNVKEIGEVARG